MKDCKCNSEERREIAREWYNSWADGKPMTEIAKKYKVSQATISNYVKRFDYWIVMDLIRNPLTSDIMSSDKKFADKIHDIPDHVLCEITGISPTSIKFFINHLTKTAYIDIDSIESSIHAVNVHNTLFRLIDCAYGDEPPKTDRDFIAGVNRHISYKKANMNKIPFTMLDMFGQPIIGYPPTAIIIDSLSKLVLEDVDDPTSNVYY